MPPWIADSEYQQYAHERVLTTSEIDAISNWVQNGSPEGDKTKTPPPPVFSAKGYIDKSPDLELKAPVYASKATNDGDDYVCFSIPSTLTKNKRIRAFEIIPGNHNIVHHALVYLDPFGNYPTDTSGSVCTGPSNGLIGGYVPGSPPTVFPSNGSDFNLGFTMFSGSNVVLAMHYPEGSLGMVDSTIIRFWFYDDVVTVRPLLTNSLIENWQFVLPANKITPVKANMNVGNQDFSVVSVFPHMHLLGKSIESFAVTPANDTLPFVNVPNWDFEWQEFLFFKNIIKVPKGTTIYGSGSYDNTTANEHNPKNPPVTVLPGLNTTDEMFLIFFHYLPYVAGDENRDIQSMSSLSSPRFRSKDYAIKVYPNPAVDEVIFELPSKNLQTLSLYIYDSQGRLVEKLMDGKSHKSLDRITWSVPEKLSSGIYYFSVNADGLFYNNSFLIQR